MLDGRYRIVRKVGEGGMSFVYLASDIATQEQYAIKVLSAALSSDANAMARLRREASLGMRLAHPNVCHIIRLGETQDGLVYVVMPYVEGEVLSDRNNRLGTLPIAEVVRHVRDIAAGLHVAHELKIVHRDLKPENVMICTQPDGGERAVVMDFGLAKERRADAELQKLTATGIILGTPEFMSPEQLRGRPLDPRTDVYSLSLMTYEMLTGEAAVQRPDAAGDDDRAAAQRSRAAAPGCTRRSGSRRWSACSEGDAARSRATAIRRRRSSRRRSPPRRRSTARDEPARAILRPLSAREDA